MTREGAPPSLLPLGAACVNQAVKGVAIARKCVAPPEALRRVDADVAAGRRYLADDDVDLTCAPAFRTAQRNSIVLHLRSVARTDAAPPPRDEATLTVAASSSPHTVAGAIAAKVREERAVCLSCVGALAVANAIFAVATARQYLRADGVDICAMPEFVEEAFGPERGGEPGAMKTVMKLVIAVTPLGSDEEQAREAARGAQQRLARPRARNEAPAARQRRASDHPGAPVRRGGRPAPGGGDAQQPVRRGGRPPKGSGGVGVAGAMNEDDDEPLGTGSRREALMRITTLI